MVKLGSSLTAVTVTRKVEASEVSTPLSAVPPLSDRVTVTTVVPLVSSATVKVRSPEPVAIAGCTLNSVVSSGVTV